jgi:hypothetical protein
LKQLRALCLKHLGKDPQTWEELKSYGAMALWLEEREKETLRTLLGAEE